MDKKGFIIIVVVGAIILAVAAGYFIVNRQAYSPAPIPSPSPSPTPTPIPNPIPTPILTIECTSDADCPSAQYSCEAIQSEGIIDPNNSGSSTFTIIKGVCKLKEGNSCSVDSDCVSGLLCHSNVCISPVGRQCSGPSDTSCPTDFQCIQGCGPPIAHGDESPPPYFCQLNGYNMPCPICLAENTLIDTPSGAIVVQNLQQGMEVWTVDISGARVPAKIIETVPTPVPSTHRIIHLVLNDGRELFVSPGHPIGDGRTIGDLSVGDVLDGGRVRIAEPILYQKEFTYDILPSGETGLYWANGILIGSTLFKSK